MASSLLHFWNTSSNVRRLRSQPNASIQSIDRLRMPSRGRIDAYLDCSGFGSDMEKH